MLPAEKPNESNEDQSTGQDSNRPDWLPEKYWSEESGEANVKGIIEALTGTQTALRNRKEELREEVLAELKKDLPQSAEDYRLEMDKLGIEDNKNFNMPEDDPLVKAAKEWAVEAGIPQEQFNKLMGLYAQSIIGSAPNAENEKKLLGENAEQRIQRLASLADAKLKSQEEWTEFALMTQTAKGIEVLEKLIESKAAASPQDFDTTGNAVFTTKNELDKLMRSDLYWKGDRATLDKASALQERLARSKAGR